VDNENISKRSDTVWHHATITHARREKLNGHRESVIWFTGLSGAGKSTLAHEVDERPQWHESMAKVIWHTIRHLLWVLVPDLIRSRGAAHVAKMILSVGYYRVAASLESSGARGLVERGDGQRA